MSTRSDRSVPASIASQWIKANALGAGFNAVAGVAVYVLGVMLDVGTPDNGTAATAVFMILSVAAVVLALVAYGVLLGVVLRQKLPAFPFRNWLALYASLGLALGTFASYMATFPEVPDPEPLTSEAIRGFIVGAVVGGALVGATVGALQAMILQGAAQGLGTWIQFSAWAGTSLVLLVLVSLGGPQTGFGNEIVSELAMFIASVVAAFFMLPALERLRPI